jgi:hypothetical protein
VCLHLATEPLALTGHPVLAGPIKSFDGPGATHSLKQSWDAVASSNMMERFTDVRRTRYGSLLAALNDYFGITR